MEARLDGKVVLITGAAQGVGLAFAREAAASGAAAVCLTDRSAEAVADAAAAIRTAGTPASHVTADLEQIEAPARIAAACLAAHGRIDALVNAAGATDRATLDDATPEIWLKLFAVNARAPYFLMQHCVRDMKRRAQPGAIVNILSINVHCGTPALSAYSASKAATAVATRNAAHALRFDRIRVNGINLGWADTPGERHMQADLLGLGEGWLAEANARQPFGRLIVPEDVARLGVFLLSDASSPMTGAVIDQEQSVPAGRD